MSTNMPVGVPRRHGSKLTNEKAPRFLEQLGSVIAKVGKTTIIDCVVRGEGDYDIDCEWYFEGKLIKDEGRFRYLYERDDVVGLEIGNISVEDEGEYKCVATNKYGKQEAKCEILVNVEGKVIDPPRDSTYEENETAVFKCKYDGNPRPEVKWFLGKKEIKNGSKYNILNKNQVASLEIYDVTLDDKGAYSIVVSNDAGEDEVNFCLTVIPSKDQQSEKGDILSMSSRIDVGLSCKHASRQNCIGSNRTLKVSKLLAGRPRTKEGNPEMEYEFLSEIGRGKFSVVKECRCKRSRNLYAAKMMRYDEGDYHNLEIAISEYELMSSGVVDHKCIPKLHETWIVRKYLVLIMDLCEGLTLLDHFANRNRFVEEDVVSVVKQLCHVFVHLHSHNILHLDIRPSNIRYSSCGNIKLVDFGSARRIHNKRRTGCVPRTIGHLEFCAPEVLDDEAISQGSDMWSVAVITYILCSGISPFFHPSTDKTIKTIQKVNWKFDENAFAGRTTDAKDFIRRIFVRVPQMRLTAEEASNHPWLSSEYRRTRLSSVITVQDQMKEICKRLNSEEAKHFIEASLVFRTFEEEEYDSPIVLSGDEV